MRNRKKTKKAKPQAKPQAKQETKEDSIITVTMEAMNHFVTGRKPDIQALTPLFSQLNHSQYKELLRFLRFNQTKYKQEPSPLPILILITFASCGIKFLKNTFAPLTDDSNIALDVFEIANEVIGWGSFLSAWFIHYNQPKQTIDEQRHRQKISNNITVLLDHLQANSPQRRQDMFNITRLPKTPVSIQVINVLPARNDDKKVNWQSVRPK